MERQSAATGVLTGSGSLEPDGVPTMTLHNLRTLGLFLEAVRISCLVHDSAAGGGLSRREEVLEILQIFSEDLEHRPVVKASVIVQSVR